MYHIICFLVLCYTSNSMGDKNKEIPKDLLMGFATASYQIEGAWDKDGKGEHIWDRFTHDNPEMIRDGSNGDVACDSYHKYKEDVQLIKDAGGQVYRFSLSWSRILPTGFSNVVNEKGIQYYNNLINELVANNIEPMVTLYHWDLPQPLEELGGWTNPVLADYFQDYAKVAFSHFGDRVKKWITFNEPFEFCLYGYGGKMFAPGKDINGIGEYLAAHTVLKAHAKAYHLYDDKFRSLQKGEIGITLSVNWIAPKTEDQCEDMDASNDGVQFSIGWFAHPIFSETGDYPEEMKKKIAERSKKEGFNRSRLPEFNEFWVNYIKGTSDFFGFNHYTTVYGTYGDVEKHPEPSWYRDQGVVHSRDSSWLRADNQWLYVVPWGFRKALNWVKNKYNNPVIYITENGFSSRETYNDDDRIHYYQSYLSEMLKAIHEDGCQIKLYTAWTLLDDFEWNGGYTQKFGLTHVDFDDPNRKRTPKKSYKYFQKIIKERKLPEDYTNIA